MLSKTFLSLVLAAGSLSAGVYGRSVPANVQTFYNQVRVYTGSSYFRCTLFKALTYLFLFLTRVAAVLVF